ncbi:MAG: hypothetical protein WCV68_00990 [Candidatus Paceibacterota bacterium]|jgi:hypothetical protein
MKEKVEKVVVGAEEKFGTTEVLSDGVCEPRVVVFHTRTVKHRFPIDVILRERPAAYAVRTSGILNQRTGTDN